MEFQIEINKGAMHTYRNTIVVVVVVTAIAIATLILEEGKHGTFINPRKREINDFRNTIE